MKKYLIGTLCGLALASLAAFDVAAQSRSEAGSSSSANASVFGQSASLAGSSSNNNLTFNTPAETNSTVTYEGSYDVSSVPSVAAPGVINTAPCMVGISGGLSVMGGGASFGGATMDEECNLRQEAAALMAVGGNKLALRHLAQDPSMCLTMRGAGVIPPNSLCTNAERKAAAKPVRATAAAAPASSTRPVARSAGYDKCELVDGKVRIRYKSGADKAGARAACLASLGY